jgi:cytochrome c-type biogenesis protein CcmH
MQTNMRWMIALGLAFLLMAGWASPSEAQTPPPEATPVTVVTDDDVNDVARRLFCPVCESEPLHTCLAPTCFEWRSEIRRQLEAGRTESEIIAYFVREGGQQVVGIPQDSGLRLLAIAGPVVALILAAWVGFLTLRKWRAVPQSQGEVSSQVTSVDDDYRARLEDDLRN